MEAHIFFKEQLGKVPQASSQQIYSKMLFPKSRANDPCFPMALCLQTEFSKLLQRWQMFKIFCLCGFFPINKH